MEDKVDLTNAREVGTVSEGRRILDMFDTCSVSLVGPIDDADG